jgi:hypothetical protein
MELHPDNRPKDVRTFIKALTGENTDRLQQLSNGTARYTPQPRLGIKEWRLVLTAAGLAFISLLLTLLRNL